MQHPNLVGSAMRAHVVFLGASNLTLGFPLIVRLAERLWGDRIEITAALGYGRSYGLPSRFLGRTLPGILQSGLWQHIAKSASKPRLALITDIGNDILYEAPVSQILEWITECVRRLQGLEAKVVLTDLPLANFEGLSERRFRVCRTILVPSCRLSLKAVEARAGAVSEGLRELAKAAKASLIVPRPEWYGFDPMHIRRSQWGAAWQAILTERNSKSRINQRPKVDLWEWLKFHFSGPERQCFFGMEMQRPQPVQSIGSSTIWLY